MRAGARDWPPEPAACAGKQIAVRRDTAESKIAASAQAAQAALGGRDRAQKALHASQVRELWGAGNSLECGG